MSSPGDGMRRVEAASGGQWEALARAAARGVPEVEPEEQRHLLSIRLEASFYAVPVEHVREIVRMRPLTSIPGVPPEVRGVIPLRGEILQVIDLRRRLRLPPVDPSRETRIVVLQGEDGALTGLLVDAVSDVLRVPESSFQPPPGGEGGAVQALCWRGRKFVSVLDLGRVLEVDRVE